MNDASPRRQVDLLRGATRTTRKTKPPSLKRGRSPGIMVATSPDGAHRHRGRAELRADRRHAAPLRPEHDGPRLQPPRRPASLRPRLGPLVPRRLAQTGRGSSCANDALPPDFARIPDDEPEGEREGRRWRARRRRRRRSSRTRSRRRPTVTIADAKLRPAEVRRRAAGSSRSTAPPLHYVVEHARRRSSRSAPGLVLRGRERRLVRLVDAGRAVGRGRPRCRRRSTRSRRARPLHYVTYVRVYRRDADGGLRRLHARLLRHAACRTASSSTARATSTRPGSARWSGTDRP